MSRGADERGLTNRPDVAACADWAVIYTPPGTATPGTGLRPCESHGHADAVLAGLPDRYLPAFAAQDRDGEWARVGQVRTS